MKTFAKIIGYGLVVLLIAMALGFTYKYTNGFNEDLKTFYVEYNGKQILTTESKLTLKQEVVHRFNVKYTFDKEDAEPKGYKVKIVSNMTRDFDYTVDGEKYLFSKVRDLTSAFEPIMHDTYFEIYLPNSINFNEILRKAHNGNSVNVPLDALSNNPYPFRLMISSYNGKITYNIDFTVDELGIANDTTQTTPTTPDNPDPVIPDVPVVTHNVSWRVTNNDAGLVHVSADIPDTAAVGEKVKFIVQLIDDYHCSIAEIDVLSGGKHIAYALPTGNSCEYGFNMPDGDVELVIALTDIVVSDYYSIGYDTLGNGSVGSVMFYCNDVAAPGDWVTASISLTPDEEARLEITHVVLQNADTGEDIQDLEAFNGLYEFTMPSCNVTLMIYLMAL